MQTQPDQILLSHMYFHVCHGVLQEEKQKPQDFRVTVIMDTDLKKAGESDCLADTVDYSKVYRQVAEIMEGPCCNLLEHLAAKISTAILKNEKINRVLVEITKIEADMGDVKVPSTVRLVRERQN